MISEQAGAYFHYDRLFAAGRIKEGRSIRNLLLLYKGQYVSLLASLLFFVVKHSPVWIIPVVMSINQVTNVYPQFARGVESIHSVLEERGVRDGLMIRLTVGSLTARSSGYTYARARGGRAARRRQKS